MTSLPVAALTSLPLTAIQPIFNYLEKQDQLDLSVILSRFYSFKHRKNPLKIVCHKVTIEHLSEDKRTQLKALQIFPSVVGKRLLFILPKVVMTIDIDSMHQTHVLRLSNKKVNLKEQIGKYKLASYGRLTAVLPHNSPFLHLVDTADIPKSLGKIDISKLLIAFSSLQVRCGHWFFVHQHLYLLLPESGKLMKFDFSDSSFVVVASVNSSKKDPILEIAVANGKIYCRKEASISFYELADLTTETILLEKVTLPFNQVFTVCENSVIIRTSQKLYRIVEHKRKPALTAMYDFPKEMQKQVSATWVKVSIDHNRHYTVFSFMNGLMSSGELGSSLPTLILDNRFQAWWQLSVPVASKAQRVHKTCLVHHYLIRLVETVPDGKSHSKDRTELLSPRTKQSPEVYIYDIAKREQVGGFAVNKNFTMKSDRDSVTLAHNDGKEIIVHQAQFTNNINLYS